VLRCPRCAHALSALTAEAACTRCDARFPIEDGILDLRVSGLDAHKQDQERFFSEEGDAYERDVVNSAFYQALDALTVGRWAAALPPDSLVLDIGSGTARVAIRLARAGHRVIAMDLTRALLRRARQKAAASGVADRIVFVLADAEHLPVADASLDAAVAHGVLHHVERPDLLVARAARALRPGGFWFSLDPNRSPLRGLFDAAMGRWPLWKEAAAPDGLQTEEGLSSWCEEAGIEPRVGFSCYVLPHLLTRLPRSIIAGALAATDAILRRSVARHFAGVIFVCGRRRPVSETRRSVSRARPWLQGAGLLLLVLASGFWRADADVAARSASYYMGGQQSMLVTASAAAQRRATLITADGSPLEDATLDDVGYMLALQLAAVAGGPVDAGAVAAWHAAGFALAAWVFAWAVATAYRSAAAGLIVVLALAVLSSKVPMLVYGQISNQTATSLFPPLLLAALLPWMRHLGPVGARTPIAITIGLGALVGVIDLVRHSHGLAALLTLAFIVVFGIASWRRRTVVGVALAAGYLLVTLAAPALLRMHRDIELGRWRGWSASYLQRPPAHHVGYTLLTSVGRYPNSLGLYYEDRSVDDYIRRQADLRTAGVRRLVEAATPLLLDYVRTHPLEYARTLVQGTMELPAFLAYTTFVAPKQWELAWPSVAPGLYVDERDVARYGEGLLQNVRWGYVRMGAGPWMVFSGAWLALLCAALSVARSRDRPRRLVVGGTLVYLTWLAVPRGLVPVQGIDFLIGFWCAAVLSALHLLMSGPPHPLPRGGR
jgi:ubiquinone/menaquinone biosynthesis C-methylase UbiE